ncbi:hypothetical protein LINPERHAP2_LOCUS13494 [Linum perenne]
MGFVGPRHTWFRSLLRERLDRCLCNSSWMSLFPDATTVHIELLKSDHRPILIRLTGDPYQVNSIRPFRFNAAWLSHDDFQPMLYRSWKARNDLRSSLQDLEGACKAWKVFGNIFVRKRALLNRLKWLEAKNEFGRISRFVEEEATVSVELQKTLWQDETLWRQKSRIRWNLEGDRNTKFFHLSTLRRRHSNRVKGLRDERGNWIFDTNVAGDFSGGRPSSPATFQARLRQFFFSFNFFFKKTFFFMGQILKTSWNYMPGYKLVLKL